MSFKCEECEAHSRTPNGNWFCGYVNEGLIYRSKVTRYRPQTCPLNDHERVLEKVRCLPDFAIKMKKEVQL